INHIEKGRALSSKDKNEYEVLIENEFLISHDLDEKYTYMKTLKKEWESNDSMAVHILTTTNCNFDCLYCYQNGIDRTESLTKSSVNTILEYFKNFVEDHAHVKHINIILHGGEPTYHWKYTKDILNGLKGIFENARITYHTQIVTNGYLLTEEKVNLLAKHNLNRVQLTIDGLKEIHDKRRRLKTGGSSFNMIVSNMKYIVENNIISKVDLRINFDYNNYNDIEPLLDYLKEIIDIKRINLSFGWISNTIKDTEASDYVGKYGVQSADVPELYIKLFVLAKKMGFEMQYFFTFDAMCTSKQKNSFVISPSGKIYKCLSMVGRDEGVIGHIDDYNPNLKNYYFEHLYKDCFNRNCEFIPICHTGCRFEAYLLTNNMDNISACRYNEMKKVNEGLLKLLNE
ncbi:MAG TPA: radical SAM protein, partial [Firmicutes bacterium]|nr:radical SAM protein [Bacillota bacterium]